MKLDLEAIQGAELWCTDLLKPDEMLLCEATRNVFGEEPFTYVVETSKKLVCHSSQVDYLATLPGLLIPPQTMKKLKLDTIWSFGQ